MKKNKQINSTNITGNFSKYYLLLAIVVLVVFTNTLFNGYNMDDHLVTQNHVHTSKGVSAIKDILSSSYYSNNTDIKFDYRPLVHVSFAIEHQLFGEHAGVSHFINLLIYLVTVLLLFKLCTKLFGENNINAALLASLIFAVHPIHTEAVASIKNRDELLALLFGLLCIYTSIKYATTNNIKWILFATVAITLGILSKKSIYPIAIIAPVILLVLNHTILKKVLFIALIMVIPAAIFGSDAQVKKAVVLILLPFLGLLTTYLLIHFKKYTPIITQLFTSISHKHIPLVLSFTTFTFGCFLKEISIIVFALVITLWSFKPNRITSILIIALQITTIAFLFDVREYHKYATVLTIAYIMQVIKITNRKKEDYIFLVLALVPLLSYLITHKSWISALMFIEIIVYFFLLNKRPLWGLLFIIFSTTFSVFVSQSSIHEYLLIGFAIFKELNVKALSGRLSLTHSSTKIAVSIVAIVTILTANPVYSPLSQKLNQQYNRFQTEYLNNKPSEVKTAGRKINYIENTLIGQYTRAELLATGFATVAEYARLTLYPAELSFYYGFAKVKTVNFTDKAVWFGLLFYLILFVIGLSQLKRHPIISIGIAWYILSISLFSNWIEPVAGMVGERLAYTASVGFCLAFSALVFWLKPSFSILKPKGIDIFIIMVLVLFSLRSMSRNSDWKDPITLMENDIEHLEKSAQAHNLLGLNLMYVSTTGKNFTQQQLMEMQNKAAIHLQKSIEIYPNFFNTNFDLARIYIGWADFTKAKPLLEQALKLDPENLFALEELAKTCYELKLVGETEKYANMYLAKIPQNENMHEILVYNMLVNNKYQSALYYAERAMSYYPNNEIIQRMYADAKRLSDSSIPKNQ